MGFSRDQARRPWGARFVANFMHRQYEYAYIIIQTICGRRSPVKETLHGLAFKARLHDLVVRIQPGPAVLSST